MHKETRPHLLMLYGGPKWDLDDFFGQRLSLLSRDFEGEVLTTGSRSQRRRYERFEVLCQNHHSWPTLRRIWAVMGYVVGKRLRRERVDLVVTSDPIMSGLLGLFASRLLGARLSVELNGDYADDVLYADPDNGRIAHRRKWVYLKIIGLVLRRSHGIKTLYPEQIVPYRKSLRKPVVAAFHNYVELSQFRNMGEEKIVLLAGFPLLVKGVDLLIEAFKRVSDRYPEWRLVILGWYPDPSLLERHIRGHARIEVRKPVHHRQMHEQVGRAGICVLASRSEGMGRFLLEAMRAGKARVGSRVGGIPTILEDGADGLLFEPGDIDGLARCLDRLMGDAALRHRLGEAAQTRAVEFDAESYYRLLRQFFLTVLGYESPSPMAEPAGPAVDRLKSAGGE